MTPEDEARLRLAAGISPSTPTEYMLRHIPLWVRTSILRGSVGGGAGGCTAFIPHHLFINGEQGVWYDPSDLRTLFQDSAGTTPVTADGDPVGLMLDKSGNGNHAVQGTSAARPIYRTDGVRHYLEGDGVDDFLTTKPIAPIPETSLGMTVIFANEPAIGFVRLGQYDSPNDRVFSFGTDGPASNSRYHFSVQQGTSFSNSLYARLTPPNSPHIATGEWQGSGKNRLRINGGVWAESSGSLTSRAVSGDQAIEIFRALGPLNSGGHVYGVLIRRGYLQDRDLDQAEKYMAKLAGVIL